MLESKKKAVLEEFPFLKCTEAWREMLTFQVKRLEDGVLEKQSLPWQIYYLVSKEKNDSRSGLLVKVGGIARGIPWYRRLYQPSLWRHESETVWGAYQRLRPELAQKVQYVVEIIDSREVAEETFTYTRFKKNVTVYALRGATLAQAREQFITAKRAEVAKELEDLHRGLV